MTSPTSVVTPERYETGMKSFAEWMAMAGEERRPEFQKHYDGYTPNADDIAAIKPLHIGKQHRSTWLPWNSAQGRDVTDHRKICIPAIPR